jgi:hypothetical protein
MQPFRPTKYTLGTENPGTRGPRKVDRYFWHIFSKSISGCLRGWGTRCRESRWQANEVTPGQQMAMVVSSSEKYLQYSNGEEKFGEMNLLTLRANKGAKD